jgi:hypothetical protein
MSRPDRESMDELALSLGRVLIASTQLEHSVTVNLASILSFNDVQERAVLRPMPISQKVTLLRRISNDYLSEADCKEVEKVSKLIGKAAEQRNDLMHGLYVHGKDDGSPAILTFSGAARIRSKPKKLTPRELEFLRLEMIHTMDELDRVRILFPVLAKLPDEIAMQKKKTK